MSLNFTEILSVHRYRPQCCNIKSDFTISKGQIVNWKWGSIFVKCMKLIILYKIMTFINLYRVIQNSNEANISKCKNKKSIILEFPKSFGRGCWLWKSQFDDPNSFPRHPCAVEIAKMFNHLLSINIFNVSDKLYVIYSKMIYHHLKFKYILKVILHQS